MKELLRIDFTDFFFNGHFVSEFGGVIADNAGGKLLYPLLPARTYATGKPYDADETFLFNSTLEPRKFEVPVFFEDLNFAGLRRIAHWLNVDEGPNPGDGLYPFYFRGDSVMIYARLDSDAYTFSTYQGNEGLTRLKFIAFDPYFYDLNETVIPFSGIKEGTPYRYYNAGTLKTHLLLSFIGTGDVQIVLGSLDTGEIQSIFVKNCVGPYTIDTAARTVYDDKGNNKFNDAWGAFPMIPPGNFSIGFTGVVQASLRFRGKYI